jgi:hypothetical protein
MEYRKTQDALGMSCGSLPNIAIDGEVPQIRFSSGVIENEEAKEKKRKEKSGQNDDDDALHFNLFAEIVVVNVFVVVVDVVVVGVVFDVVVVDVVVVG